MSNPFRKVKKWRLRTERRLRCPMCGCRQTVSGLQPWAMTQAYPVRPERLAPAWEQMVATIAAADAYVQQYEALHRGERIFLELPPTATQAEVDAALAARKMSPEVVSRFFTHDREKLRALRKGLATSLRTLRATARAGRWKVPLTPRALEVWEEEHGSRPER